MHEELGRGAFAIVYRCSLKTTGEERAAKIIDLRPIRMRGSLNLDRVMRYAYIFVHFPINIDAHFRAWP